MTNQLTLMIPKVDEKATRAKVKKAFKAYHENKATLETLENFFPTHWTRGIKGPTMKTTVTAPNTDADLIRGGHVSNTGQDLTMLAERMEEHQKRTQQLKSSCELIELAVEALPAVERQIMRLTLMIDPNVRQNDSLIWPKCQLGKSEYYKHKEKAMLRIAFALQIEVYEQEGDVAA